MRFWDRLVHGRPAVPEPPRAERELDLPHLVDEGYLVAASALRLSVKNGVIMATLRDGLPWDELAAIELAHQAVDDLVAELASTADRLAIDAEQAARAVAPAPAPRRRRDDRRARAERARRARQLDEAARLDARARTLRGVVDRLRTTHERPEELRAIVLRARDETLGELMQARLIPRAPAIALTPEEEREALEGIKADLQLLIDERTGY